MNNLKSIFGFTFLLIFLTLPSKAQNIKINEVVSSNSIYFDEDGDTPDWIELHNKENKAVSLLNWGISDDESSLDKWKFPDITLQPDEYILLWASSKDRSITSFLHTNFKISSSSETIFLSDNNGNIVDQLLVEGLNSNNSIGLSKNNTIVYFNDTTPGEPNSETQYLGILNSNITFSHQGGKIDAAINVSLSGNTENQVIRYTTDGTLPIETSTIYNSAIQILKSSVIRARLFADNYIPSLSTSKSYLLNANHEIDIVSLVTDPDNLFNNDTGIYVLGDSYSDKLPNYGANFWEDWERPIHVSFYEKGSGNLGIAFNGGVKIFGGYSRSNKQRSLSIFARGQYGTSEIEYPFFDNLEYNKFQSFVLRNSGNDWLNSSIRDAALTSLMKDSGLDFQAYKPVATYINAEYWGMYNLREKVNEHFLASKHNIDAEDVTLLGNNGQIIEGTNKEYNELINYVNTTNLVNDSNFEYVKERVDLKNYAVYQTAQIYFNNQDWPGNNIKFWKHPKGKWRWILYDTDFTFGIWDTNNVNDNTLEFALQEGNPNWPNPDWSTLLFRNLLTNISFRNTFINRFSDELNTRFLPENVKNHIDSIFKNVEPEIAAYYTRWGANPLTASYNVNRMKTFADERIAVVKQHIQSKFNLPNIHTITINNNNITEGFVKVNDNLEIKETSWNGEYFETVPVELTAVAEPGFEFSHWSGASTANTATIQINLIENIEITPNFKAVTMLESVVINEINYKSSDDSDTDDWVELYNPNEEAIDVSNWIFKDDDDSHTFVLPTDTNIPGNGYLILTKNAADFSIVYPEIANIVGDFDFGLGSKSDAVRIFNASEVLQDSVYYDIEADWSDCAQGTGSTLELNETGLDNNLAASWDCINENGSPGKDNNFSDTLNIAKIKLYPNPVNDYLYIDGMSANANIIIYNMLGKIIIKSTSVSRIDIQFLNSGIYFVKIFEDNREYNYKMIKE